MKIKSKFPIRIAAKDLPDVTDEEIRMMQNALGLTPRGRNLSYRNHFCLYPGSDTYLTWCSLVERKLAEVQSIETTHGIYPDLGRMRTFTVTDLGRVLIARNRKRR